MKTRSYDVYICIRVNAEPNGDGSPDDKAIAKAARAELLDRLLHPDNPDNGIDFDDYEEVDNSDPEEWRIVGMNDGRVSYWSNEWGWTVSSEATIFSNDDKELYANLLPEGGRWEVLS